LSRYVIDASAAAEYLLRTPLGLKLADLRVGLFLIAPELIDVEVLSVMQRAVLHHNIEEHRARNIEEHRARFALEDLRDWPIDLISHTALVREAWSHRHNVSTYDAFYVAAVRIYDAPLLTADGPLSRSPALGIVVQNIRMG
jgi:predicted nucleic acid-binding protein